MDTDTAAQIGLIILEAPEITGSSLIMAEKARKKPNANAPKFLVFRFPETPPMPTLQLSPQAATRTRPFTTEK